MRVKFGTRAAARGSISAQLTVRFGPQAAAESKSGSIIVQVSNSTKILPLNIGDRHSANCGATGAVLFRARARARQCAGCWTPPGLGKYFYFRALETRPSSLIARSGLHASGSRTLTARAKISEREYWGLSDRAGELEGALLSRRTAREKTRKEKRALDARPLVVMQGLSEISFDLGIIGGETFPFV